MAIDYNAIFGATPFDPCAALSALRPTFMQMQLERQPSKVVFRDREVWFEPADLEAWRLVIRDLESQCNVATGTPSRRQAFVAGYRYPGFPFFRR